MVEDALGFKFPVPSECDFSILNAIIKHRFQEGPGALDVNVGNYELFYTKNSGEVLSASGRVLSGSSITMAILISRALFCDEECPMPRCKSVKTVEVPGGGRMW